MKKLFSITLVMVIMVSLFAPVVYASESDLEKVIKDVDETNKEINETIYEAIEEAEKEISNYLKDLEILEYGEKFIDLEKEISELKEKLDNLNINKKDYQKKYDKILKKINKKELKILNIVNKQKDRTNKLLNDIEELELELKDIDSSSKKNINIKDKINKIQAKLDKSDREIQKLNNKINEKIDKIINDLIDDTNKKAAEMKEKAAEKGFEVICELVEVEIGGQNVWIDPLRIAAF